MCFISVDLGVPTQQRIFGSIQIGEAKAQQYPWVSTSNHQRSTPWGATTLTASPVLRAAKGLSSIVSNRRSQCLQHFRQSPKSMEVAKIWRKSFIKMVIDSLSLSGVKGGDRFNQNKNGSHHCGMAFPKRASIVAFGDIRRSILVDPIHSIPTFPSSKPNPTMDLGHIEPQLGWTICEVCHAAAEESPSACAQLGKAEISLRVDATYVIHVPVTVYTKISKNCILRCKWPFLVRTEMVDVTLEAAAQWQNKLNGFAASPLRSRIDGFRPILSSMREVCLDNPAALQMNTLDVHPHVGRQ